MGLMMMNYFFAEWLTDERLKPYIQSGPLSEILTTANLQHTISRVSEPIIMISDFKFFPKMLLRQLNVGVLFSLKAILRLLQRKNSTFL